MTDPAPEARLSSDAPLTPNQRRVILATALASAMAFIDQTAVNTALPVMQRQLGGSVTDAQWIVEIYMLFMASLILAAGALGDKLGRRKVFRWGVAGFAVTSLACGLAQTADQLIAARAAQGVAAALLTPSSLALLNASFPPGRRAYAVGIWAAITSLVIPLGPVLGGALTDSVGWSWIFFINLPISLVVLAALRGVERPAYDPPEGAPLDLPGAVTVTLGLGGLTYALLEAQRLGLGDGSVRAGLALAIVMLPLFLVIEARAARPMLPLWLFRVRLFAGINAATFLLFAGFMGANFFIPFMFIQARGYTALEAGLALFPLTVAITILSRYAGAITARVGRRPPVTAGPILAGLGLLGIGHVPFGGAFWTGYFPFICVMALGMGLTVAPLTATAMNAAGEGRSGLAAGVNNAVARTGQLAAIAGLGLAMVPAFRAALADALAAADLPAAVRASVEAGSLKLGALDIPAGLNAAQAAAVEAATRSALLDAFALTMTVTAGLTIVAGLVAGLAVGGREAAPG